MTDWLIDWGPNLPENGAVLDGTSWNIPGGRYSQKDSTRRCGLLATITVATCYLLVALKWNSASTDRHHVKTTYTTRSLRYRGECCTVLRTSRRETWRWCWTCSWWAEWGSARTESCPLSAPTRPSCRPPRSRRRPPLACDLRSRSTSSSVLPSGESLWVQGGSK